MSCLSPNWLATYQLRPRSIYKWHLTIIIVNGRSTVASISENRLELVELLNFDLWPCQRLYVDNVLYIAICLINICTHHCMQSARVYAYTMSRSDTTLTLPAMTRADIVEKQSRRHLWARNSIATIDLVPS